MIFQGMPFKDSDSASGPIWTTSFAQKRQNIRRSPRCTAARQHPTHARSKAAAPQDARLHGSVTVLRLRGPSRPTPPGEPASLARPDKKSSSTVLSPGHWHRQPESLEETFGRASYLPLSARAHYASRAPPRRLDHRPQRLRELPTRGHWHGPRRRATGKVSKCQWPLSGGIRRKQLPN
jgi:hypothetical protein